MSRDEVTSNSDKIKPIVLAIIELRLPEGIRQAGRQLVSRKFHGIIKKKIHNNLLEAFKIILKALLALVIPNQYCQGARMKF